MNASPQKTLPIIPGILESEKFQDQSEKWWLFPSLGAISYRNEGP